MVNVCWLFVKEFIINRLLVVIFWLDENYCIFGCGWFWILILKIVELFLNVFRFFIFFINLGFVWFFLWIILFIRSFNVYVVVLNLFWVLYWYFFLLFNFVLLKYSEDIFLLKLLFICLLVFIGLFFISYVIFGFGVLVIL